MKIALLLLVVTIYTISFGQIPYEDDHKKWGLSKNGTGDKKDSIIVRAEFDEIVNLHGAAGDFFIGKKNDEWQTISSNKLVNQQRYTTISIPEFVGDIAVGYREGYIDLIKADSVVDFVIRGVQADGLIDGADYLGGESNFVMTVKGKDAYGVINTKSGKEILKTAYMNIQTNDPFNESVCLITYKDAKNAVHDVNGKLRFELPTELMVTSLNEIQGSPGSYEVVVNSKKGTVLGFYNEENRWFIPPMYQAIELIDHLPEVIIATGDKGQGVFFKGKLILPCEYLSIQKSDKEGYLVLATGKKGKYYVTPEGKLVAPQE